MLLVLATAPRSESTQLPLEQLPLRVAAHEPRPVAPRLEQRDGLARQRTPGQVAAGDDQVRLLPLDLGEHGLERHGVAVDVRERRDPHRL